MFLMEKFALILLLVLLLASLIAPGTGVPAGVTGNIGYRLDLTAPGSGEITVAVKVEGVTQSLVLELPDSYGDGLASGLSSHILGERAVDGSGRELPVNRDGDTWTINGAGTNDIVTFSYTVKVSGYQAGTPYLDGIAGAGTPWPYFPLLEEDLAYLPGYAVLVRPKELQGMTPTLELDLPAQWQQALPWTERPSGFDELLDNPLYAGEISLLEQGPLLVALPAAAAAASGGGLVEYAGKAQQLLEESESLLGGLGLPEGQRLLLALLFRGGGDSPGDPYYPSSSFSRSVVIPAGAGNDPLSDSTIEATARGMASLLLSRQLEVGGDALWLKEGSAWYLQDLVPYEAGMWGASLFWDRFNAGYDTYRGARSTFGGSMAEAGVLANGCEDAAMILTCGGASACASFDSELRSMQPYALDLPAFLRNLSEMSSAEDPLSNDDVLAILVNLTGRDWSAFFRDYIKGGKEIPASSFSSLNIAESGGSNTPADMPDTEASTSDWIFLVIAVLVVLAIPFVLEPYTMRPRKPGFLEKELAKDDEDN